MKKGPNWRWRERRPGEPNWQKLVRALEDAETWLRSDEAMVVSHTVVRLEVGDLSRKLKIAFRRIQQRWGFKKSDFEEDGQ